MKVGKAGAKRIRVGIIGANPDRGWAAQAHIPALKALSDKLSREIGVPLNNEFGIDFTWHLVATNGSPRG